MEITTRKDAFNQGTVENESGLKGKVIRNMTVAKRLIDKIDQKPTNEIRVIGIKADRSDPEHKRSVVIFEDNDKFQEAFTEVLNDYRGSREGRNDSTEVEDLKNRIAELEKRLANKEG